MFVIGETILTIEVFKYDVTAWYDGPHIMTL